MERFFNQTKAFLSVIQAAMKPDEREKSAEIAEEMYEAISAIVNKHQINILQTINAVLAVNTTVLELALQQIEERREGEQAK